MNFFAELKRRNVYKVAIAYAVVAWLLVQVATQVFPFLEIPNWVTRLVIALVVIGFPIALVIAWAFETTPEGIKRTEDVDLSSAARAPKKHAWIYVVLIGAAISAALFFLGRYTAGSKTAAIARNELSAKSIAVLPFDNLSRDPDNAYFAEGVQDEILTRLAKVADLKVISRTSTQRFKSAPDNLPAIAKQLGVMHILEGSVQKANDQVRVNVQLINALTDAHLWADTYDRKLIDIFAVESEIAKTIADTLQARLTGSEKTAMAKEPTANTEAYELYHNQELAIAFQAKGDLPHAIAQFEKAKQFSDDPIIAAELAAAKALAGDKDAAKKTLAELDNIARQREVAAYARALLCLSLDNKQEALHWLEQDFEDGDGGNIGAINVDPLLYPLHGEPRFEALVQKVVAPKK